MVGNVECFAEELKPVALTEKQPLRKSQVGDISCRLLISIAVDNRNPVFGRRSPRSVKGTGIDNLLYSRARGDGKRAGGAADACRVRQSGLRRESRSHLKVIDQITQCSVYAPRGARSE